MGVRKGAGEKADGKLMGNGWGLAHIRLVCLLQAVERLHLAPVGSRPAVVEVECGVGVSECLGEAAELDPHESAVGEVEGPPRCVETAARQRVEQLQLGWATAGERPRINNTWLPSLRDVRPCVVHANSATKSIMPILQLFLERVHLPFANAPDNAAASSKPGELVGIRAPTERDVAMVVDAWHEELMEKTLNPCIIGARTIPGLGANEARVHHACTSFKQKYMQQFIAKHHRRPLG